MKCRRCWWHGGVDHYWEPCTCSEGNDITRVEVIDQDWRNYVNWRKNNRVELSYQDDGKTLKIFIS